jgi:hypothetical protein
MAIIFDAGFEVIETRRLLDAWWIERVACPVTRRGGPSERVLTLMELHWSEHGAALPVGARCCPDPCPALGVARARLEIHWFGITLLEVEEFRRLETASSELPADDPLRAEYVRKANELSTGFVSKAAVAECFCKATGGRPQLSLAHAVAQHLWHGGFKAADIAELMGCTVAAARQRSKAAGRWSLGASNGRRPARTARADRSATRYG